MGITWSRPHNDEPRVPAMPGDPGFEGPIVPAGVVLQYEAYDPTVVYHPPMPIGALPQPVVPPPPPAHLNGPGGMLVIHGAPNNTFDHHRNPCLLQDGQTPTKPCSYRSNHDPELLVSLAFAAPSS